MSFVRDIDHGRICGVMDRKAVVPCMGLREVGRA